MTYTIDVMKKCIAVIDIDNTIADTQNTIREYLEKKGVNPARLTSNKEEFRDDITKDFNTHISEFIHSTDYENTLLTIPLISGVLQALQVLNKSCDLYIVSSRINNWHAPTMTWLHSTRVMPFIKKVYLREVSESSVAFKKRVTAELKADVLFEDSLDIIRSLENIQTRFLIDQPWNQDNISTDKYTRAHSFAEAVATFQSLPTLHRRP